jgi:hypothetical protein
VIQQNSNGIDLSFVLCDMSGLGLDSFSGVEKRTGRACIATAAALDPFGRKSGAKAEADSVRECNQKGNGKENSNGKATAKAMATATTEILHVRRG